MGGSGSGRWMGVATRPQMDQFCAIDVRHLAKLGLFSNAHEGRDGLEIRWSRGGVETDAAVVHCPATGEPLPSLLTVRFSLHDQDDGNQRLVQETIALCRTAVHLGGERLWFQCPGCSRRCAILRKVEGAFRCGQCHRLAYASTREDAGVRALRRCTKLFDRLQAPEGTPWGIPGKPRGMHKSTYARIAGELRQRIPPPLNRFPEDGE